VSVETIRTGLTTALTTLSLRTVHETDATPNVSGSALAAMVEVGPVVPAAFGGTSMDMSFRVIVLAGRASERTARLKLDEFIDPTVGSGTALANALNGTLGGTVGFCTVSASSEYRNYPVGDAEYLGCEFTVVIGT
jgi:hypothetical protein